jgi:hypothetical protein
VPTEDDRAKANYAKGKKANDAAAVLAGTVASIRATGVTSIAGIARELNARQIPTAAGGQWYPMTVSRLLATIRDQTAARRRLVLPN